MTLKIKGWDRFQHFKDRKPVWIKLYRDLLDEINWHELAGDDAKTLVMLWLISSENNGELPSIKEIAFRLRVTEKSIKSTISRLSKWLIQDDINTISDINAISDGYQDNTKSVALTRSLEKRREETDTERFALFWKAYPKKKARPAAEKAFKSQKINGEFQAILDDIEKQSKSDDWKKNDGQFIPYPATYLNARRWEDAQDPCQTEKMGFV